jgi:hypothetical protein
MLIDTLLLYVVVTVTFAMLIDNVWGLGSGGICSCYGGDGDGDLCSCYGDDGDGDRYDVDDGDDDDS